MYIETDNHIISEYSKLTQRMRMVIHLETREKLNFGHRVKVEENEKKYKKLNLARELKKKTLKRANDGDTNCNWGARYSPQRIGSGPGGLENKKMS